MKGGVTTMTLKEFKEIADNLYYYATAGAYPEETNRFPEREQDSFFNGYATALRDVLAELNMDKVPENQQRAFLKGYYKGMQEVMQELKKLD
jgi:hypothetical protein